MPDVPLLIGVRCGALRRWQWGYWGVLAAALMLATGWPGAVMAVLVLCWQYRATPPQFWVLTLFQADANALWLDRHRIVFGNPYRIVYRDEVTAADFARLCRIGRGIERLHPESPESR